MFTIDNVEVRTMWGNTVRISTLSVVKIYKDSGGCGLRIANR